MVALLAVGAAVAVVGSAHSQADPRRSVVPPGRLSPTGATLQGAAAGPTTERPGTDALDAATSPAGPPDVASLHEPDVASLLEIADEVSSDGRYVRIGQVEISASPVVSRSP